MLLYLRRQVLAPRDDEPITEEEIKNIDDYNPFVEEDYSEEEEEDSES